MWPLAEHNYSKSFHPSDIFLKRLSPAANRHLLEARSTGWHVTSTDHHQGGQRVLPNAFYFLLPLIWRRVSLLIWFRRDSILHSIALSVTASTFSSTFVDDSYSFVIAFQGGTIHQIPLLEDINDAAEFAPPAIPSTHNLLKLQRIFTSCSK